MYSDASECLYPNGIPAISLGVKAISRVEDTGEWATVYNMRVADWHTYFVGAAEWGFSVWAHNAECVVLGVWMTTRVIPYAAKLNTALGSRGSRYARTINIANLMTWSVTKNIK